MFDSYSDIFAARGGDYHGAMAAWPRARDAEFRAALEPLEGRGGTLLDIPGGGGYLAAFCGEGWDYVGIEPSDGFFDAANAALRRIRAEPSRVPLPEDTADAIVSLAGLHHEPDLAAVFAEFKRLLRPGGRAVIADVEDGTGPARFLNGFVDGHNPQGHDGRFFGEGTATLLCHAGLTVEEDGLVAVPWCFASREEAGAFCRRLFHLPVVDAATVAAALERDVGFDPHPQGVCLRWSLRRLVCTA